LYERDSPLPYEAIAIGAVVLLNAVMGYLQEQRAESAIAALQQMAAAHAHVIRDGVATTIPSADGVAATSWSSKKVTRQQPMPASSPPPP
jgi:Ca2+-transporting ATPase